MGRLVLCSVFVCFASLGPGAAFADGLVLFATRSTELAMGEAAKKFTEQSELKVTVRFASPGLLAQRIEDGERPNIAVLDGKSWMDRLSAAKTLAPNTRRPLFSNRLVLVTHRDFPHALPIAVGGMFVELLDDGKFVIADPKLDPAGVLAQHALKFMAVPRRMEEKLHIVPDVRSALRRLDEGSADAGIVYATDARTSDQINISGVFLRSMHPPIVYEIAILAGHETPETRHLNAFLLSRTAREIYTRHGFVLE